MGFNVAWIFSTRHLFEGAPSRLTRTRALLRVFSSTWVRNVNAKSRGKSEESHVRWRSRNRRGKKAGRPCVKLISPCVLKSPFTHSRSPMTSLGERDSFSFSRQSAGTGCPVYLSAVCTIRRLRHIKVGKSVVFCV